MLWYYNNEGSAEGPLKEEAMIALFTEGKITERTLIFHTEDQNWKSVETSTPPWLGLAQQRMAAPKPMSAKPEITQVELDDKPVSLIKKLLGYFGRR